MKILVEGQVVIRKQQVLVTGFFFEGDPDDPRTTEQTIIDWTTKQIREARFGAIYGPRAEDVPLTTEGVTKTVTDTLLIIAEEIGIEKLVRRLAAVFKDETK